MPRRKSELGVANWNGVLVTMRRELAAPEGRVWSSDSVPPHWVCLLLPVDFCRRLSLSHSFLFVAWISAAKSRHVATRGVILQGDDQNDFVTVVTIARPRERVVNWTAGESRTNEFRFPKRNMKNSFISSAGAVELAMMRREKKLLKCFRRFDLLSLVPRYRFSVKRKEEKGKEGEIQDIWDSLTGLWWEDPIERINRSLVLDIFHEYQVTVGFITKSLPFDSACQLKRIGPAMRSHHLTIFFII